MWPLVQWPTLQYVVPTNRDKNMVTREFSGIIQKWGWSITTSEKCLENYLCWYDVSMVMSIILADAPADDRDAAADDYYDVFILKGDHVQL